MNLSRRKLATAIVSGLVTVGALTWIWRTQFAAPPFNAALHREVGRRLAEETARALHEHGRLVLVSLESGSSAIADTQRQAFLSTLARWPGLSVVREDRVDAEKSSKYGPGAGFSARRFLKLAGHCSDVRAIVSLLGVPDAAELPTTPSGSSGPPLIALTRSHKKLTPLLEQGRLEVAVVPRFLFPAPGPERPTTAAEWFENRFQVVRRAASPGQGAGI